MKTKKLAFGGRSGESVDKHQPQMHQPGIRAQTGSSPDDEAVVNTRQSKGHGDMT